MSDGSRTRRRGAALETALLAAAWAEVKSAGYAGLTFEAVAERAGTSRAVLYRRWRSRPEIFIAALRQHSPLLSGEIPDTGSLRGDVLAVLRRMAIRLTEVGTENVAGLLGDVLADAEVFDRLHDQVVLIGAEVMTTMLKRATDRGEARPDVSIRIATLPTDLFRHNLLVNRRPPSDGELIEIVDDIFLPLVRP